MSATGARRPVHRVLRVALGLLAALLLAAALVAWLNLRGEPPLLPDAADSRPPDAALAQRGAYLARAGNCAGCHTARGGAAYAGGRGIATPFGTVMAGNLTPDPRTGLGSWTAAQFRRALHHGRSADGRLLVPAFPYTHFTLVSRADADALWAHLRSLPPVVQANAPHRLRWPYGSQAALAVWRALYFRPGTGAGDDGLAPDATAQLQRGAYLVNGLGHCSACHASRGVLGGSSSLATASGQGSGGDGSGNTLPGQRWQAPSLTDRAGLNLAGRQAGELVQLLQTGLSPQAAVMGPMAEVVADSTQHLAPDDLRAMVAYLQQLARQQPQATRTASTATLPPRPGAVMLLGERLYTDQCQACHGAQGQGAAGAYPALAGNPIVTLAAPDNLVQAITGGGFAPATAGNPRPYGMPGFDLDHGDLAALATWLRAS